MTRAAAAWHPHGRRKTKSTAPCFEPSNQEHPGAGIGLLPVDLRLTLSKARQLCTILIWGTVVEEPAHYLQSPRVLWGAAALTIAASVAAVLAVREVAVRVLQPDPAFTPLSLGSPIVATIVCTAMAIYVFVGMVSYPNPARAWLRVSAIVLILSFVPCVLLAISHIMGGSWPQAFALMTMHIVVWAVCVTLLPSLAITKHRPKTQASDRPLSIL
jgi:Family of unknown function (DUF6069)